MNDARGWRKLGLVSPGPQGCDWAVSHAALPVVDVSLPGACRVYFCARDAEGRAQIGVGHLDLAERPPRLAIDPRPVITRGALGAFDDSGVTSSCLVIADGRRYQYYTGWTRGVTVPRSMATRIGAIGVLNGERYDVAGSPLFDT